jgi:hypothetical protein
MMGSILAPRERIAAGATARPVTGLRRWNDCELVAPQPMTSQAAVPVMNTGKTLQMTNPFGVSARNAPIGKADRRGKPNLN